MTTPILKKSNSCMCFGALLCELERTLRKRESGALLLLLLLYCCLATSMLDASSIIWDQRVSDDHQPIQQQHELNQQQQQQQQCRNPPLPPFLQPYEKACSRSSLEAPACDGGHALTFSSGAGLFGLEDLGLEVSGFQAVDGCGSGAVVGGGDGGGGGEGLGGVMEGDLGAWMREMDGLFGGEKAGVSVEETQALTVMNGLEAPQLMNAPPLLPAAAEILDSLSFCGSQAPLQSSDYGNQNWAGGFGMTFEGVGSGASEYEGFGFGGPAEMVMEDFELFEGPAYSSPMAQQLSTAIGENGHAATGSAAAASTEAAEEPKVTIAVKDLEALLRSVSTPSLLPLSPPFTPPTATQLPSSPFSHTASPRLTDLANENEPAPNLQNPHRRRRPSKLYPCPHCPRTFTRQSNLKTHIPTHSPSRPRPFVCNHASGCTRGFVRIYELERHMRTHVKQEVEKKAGGVETGERRWRCGGCGRAFGRRDVLRRHCAGKRGVEGGCFEMKEEEEEEAKTSFQATASTPKLVCLWDLLPTEIRHRILQLCDPLTQYLNQFAEYHPLTFSNEALPSRKRQQLVNGIWKSALENEWEGDLKTLPGWFHPKNKFEWCAAVKSRSTLQRLMEMEQPKPSNFDLADIAMRHCWIDLLDPTLSERTKCYLASTGGHLAYFLQLAPTQSSSFYFERLTSAVALEGNLAGMKRILRMHQLTSTDTATTASAAKSGNLDLMKLLLKNGFGCNIEAIIGASEWGHLEMVQYLHENVELLRWSESDYRRLYFSSAMDKAACNGHLKVVEFLHFNRTEGCSDSALRFAARHGHLAVVRFLRQNRSEGVFADAMRRACGLGHLDVVRYLFNDQRESETFDEQTLSVAAAKGYYEIVEFLHRNNTSLLCNEWALEKVLQRCFGRIFLYLHTNNLSNISNHQHMLRRVLKHATKSGNTMIIDILLEAHSQVNINVLAKIKHRCGRYLLRGYSTAYVPLHTCLINLVATHGHLATLKHLHNHPALTWSTDAMDLAAENGHLDVVAFLHENRTEGCTAKAMDWAAANGHLHVVRYLHRHRVEGCTTSAMDDACHNGRLEVVRFLHESRSEGCTVKAMDWAAGKGHFQIVEFLHIYRKEGCTTLAMDQACTNGHLEVVEFLHKHRKEGCTTAAMDQACRNGHLEVVKFLHENRTEGCTSLAMELAVEGSHWRLVAFLHDCRNERCSDWRIEWAVEKGHLDVKYLNEGKEAGSLSAEMKEMQL
ncbi:hypothetical protein HDV05_001819 [Chytridiales sp. JEL 0842]|nr:hypothetical protein HDV05_001819 [Chytridiales sp. JEL 0842]